METEGPFRPYVSGVSSHLLATQADGAPCTTRTCDLLVRSQTLYPAELRARGVGLVVRSLLD